LLHAEKSEPVAFTRVPCAEFKVRNEGQKQNIIVISKLFSFLFDSNDVSATKAFEKISVTGDEKTTRGSGGGAQSRRMPTVVWGRSLQRCGEFPDFFKT